MFYLLEKELFMKHESDRPLYLLSKIDKLLQKGKVLEEFKLKKIIDETKINLIKEYINVFIHIHNSLHPQKYIIIRKNLVLLFDIFNKIVSINIDRQTILIIKIFTKNNRFFSIISTSKS